MTNQQLLDKFYTSFKNRDYQGMNECYHPEAQFEDPVFKLQGKQICAMWHMLVSGGSETKIHFKNLRADERSGYVDWQAHYPFGPRKRRVHNIVQSQFEFKDGKIFRQRDTFNAWRWSRMALGPIGLFLGWSNFLQTKIKKLGAKRLQEFTNTHPEYL